MIIMSMCWELGQPGHQEVERLAGTQFGSPQGSLRRATGGLTGEVVMLVLAGGDRKPADWGMEEAWSPHVEWAVQWNLGGGLPRHQCSWGCLKAGR